MKPNDSMLRRRYEKHVQRELDKIAETVEEVVNFGTYILDWCQEKYVFKAVEAPIFTTYHQFLSTTDAMSVLIRKGHDDGLKPLLRAMLELSFNLEYMLKREDLKGILAYRVAHTMSRIKTFKSLDPSTPHGKNTLDKVQKYIGGLKINSTEIVRQHEDYLKQPEYALVFEEWKRLKENRGREPVWHSLFGGPSKISDLASELEQDHLYLLLYKDLSTFIHGSGTLNKIEITRDGVSVLPQLRTLDRIPSHAQIMISVGIRLYRELLIKYNPDKQKDYAEWYLTIRKKFLDLSNIKFVKEYN